MKPHINETKKEKALQRAKELEKQEEPFPSKEKLEEDNIAFRKEAKKTKQLMDKLEDIER